MPHFGKMLTRFQQVGAASERLGLSVSIQTLPISPNDRSRIKIVDYVYTELRTPQICIYSIAVFGKIVKEIKGIYPFSFCKKL